MVWAYIVDATKCVVSKHKNRKLALAAYNRLRNSKPHLNIIVVDSVRDLNIGDTW